MARVCAFAAHLAVAAGGAASWRGDTVSFFQSVTHGTVQLSGETAVHHAQRREIDLQDYKPTFVVGETAEVKSHVAASPTGWVLCHVLGPGAKLDTYNIIVPGTAVMNSVPAVMLRKRQKATTTPMPTGLKTELGPDGGGIDGEPGEQVEILIRKGLRAGSWVPGEIVGAGSMPDSYNIRVITKANGWTEIPSIAGSLLRKAIVTTTESPLEDEPEHYQVGDRVKIRSQETGEWIPCSIMAKGSSPDTYTVFITEVGYVPDVPRKAMRLAQNQGKTNSPQVFKQPEDYTPKTTQFEVGEDVQLKMTEGDLLGIWLNVRIKKKGIIPWTYTVDFTQHRLEYITNIETWQELLRRPGEHFDRGAMTTYEIGEKVEFKINDTSTMWGNATITDKGQAPYTFNLTLPSGREIPSVAVELLRKAYFNESTLPTTSREFYREGDHVEFKNFLTGYWWNGTILGMGDVAGTYEVDAGDGKGTVLHWMPPELLRRPVTSFRVGELVEVKGTKNGSVAWPRGMVTGLGSLPGTYDIALPEVGPVSGVRFHKMRRAPPVPERQLMMAYEVGEKVQMRVLYGISAGQWVNCTIAGRGFLSYSYNVSLPGAGTSPNIPIELLRKVVSSRFKVGEFVKVRMITGPNMGKWGDGMISSSGTKPDTFNIDYWNRGVAPNVPVELIRKANQPYRPEELPVYEVGSSVKVKLTLGPDEGEWLAGIVKGHNSIVDTPNGPRPEMYRIMFPSLADADDFYNIPVELVARDELALRPVTSLEEFEANDTVKLKGVVGLSGAEWIKVYIHKNGTKRESYDVHLPSVGIFEDIPIELIRRVDTLNVLQSSYQAGDEVEIKDIFDLAEDGSLWHRVTVRGKGKRPDTYDLGAENSSAVMDCVPYELIRRADGQGYRKVERMYQKGEVVEVKDILGVISPNATTKEFFKILGPGKLENTFDLDGGPFLGVIHSVPRVLLKKDDPEDNTDTISAIEIGDILECLDIDKPGSRLLCRAESAGARPGTFNVRVAGYEGVFPNIPTSRMIKKPLASVANESQELNGREVIMVGDKVEVYDPRKEGNPWVQGTVVGWGKKNSFDVSIGGTKLLLKNIPVDKLRLPQEGDAVLSTTKKPEYKPEAVDDDFSVGDSVKYKGPGTDPSNSSSWVSCIIMSEGRVPFTFDLGFQSGVLSSNVPFFYLQKQKRAKTTTPAPEVAQTWSILDSVMPTVRTFQAVFKKMENELVKQIEGDDKAVLKKMFLHQGVDPDVVYEIGEEAEVQVIKGEYKGSYAPCEITGMGKFANSYNIRLTGGREGAQDIPNVGTRVLRKVIDSAEVAKIRAASKCTEDDRQRMMQTITSGGFFSDMPEECGKAISLLGINEDAFSKCAMKKFSISAQCTPCTTDFMKEVAGKSCLATCLPMVQACQSSAGDAQACVNRLADCMTCTKAPLLSFVTCIGVGDPTTSFKLDQLSEAVGSGKLMQPGVLEGIFGDSWVSSHRGFMLPLLDAAKNGGQETTPPPKPAFQVGEKAEIRIQKGPYAGNWIECEISGVGKLQGTYKVHVPSAPAGRQDIPMVSGRILRKSEASADMPVTPAPGTENEDPA